MGIYMTDPIDEYAVQQIDEFDDHKLVNAAKEDIKFGDAEEKNEKKIAEKREARLKGFTTWLKKELDKHVVKVVVSNRLTESPCVLVSGQYGWSANMERLMRSQALADPKRHQ